MILKFVAQKWFPHWGQRPITDGEIRSRLRKKVIFTEGKIDVPGLYTEYQGYLWIVIDQDLRGLMKDWVLRHEVGHFLLHIPAMQCFDPTYRRKADREANIFAAVAMIPTSWLHEKTFNELLEEGYPEELLWIRKEYFELTTI